ncbi:hypothetical protein [Nonomuraea candida]|uniref:hypothetical protein n=1 Tax=Nonomuraea candida TaxID=359159 RepID=UPI0012F802C4|nr:hypothetical protein [Nonomuraea candida]
MRTALRKIVKVGGIPDTLADFRWYKVSPRSVDALLRRGLLARERRDAGPTTFGGLYVAPTEAGREALTPAAR